MTASIMSVASPARAALFEKSTHYSTPTLPRMRGLSASDAATPDAATTVVAKCARCNEFIGQYPNRWKQITNSYFALGDLNLPIDLEMQNLRLVGQPKLPNGGNKIFEGCTIQQLHCPKCSDDIKLGFKCVDSRPDVQAYRGHVFYKLSKLRLFHPISNQITGPIVDPVSPERARRDFSSENGSIHIVNSRSVSPLAEQKFTKAKDPQFERADRDAVKGTNDGSLDWQEAHENWTLTTRLELSPKAFSNRILELGGGQLVKSAMNGMNSPVAQLPLPASAGGGFRPINANIPTPPPPANLQKQTSLPTPVSRSVPDQPILPPMNTFRPPAAQEPVADLRRDISRIDEKVAYLQQQVDTLVRTVGRLDGKRENADSVELLTETVSRLSTRFGSRDGEMEGLRVTLDSLRGRVRKLEGGNEDPRSMPPVMEPIRPQSGQPAIPQRAPYSALSNSPTIESRPQPHEMRPPYRDLQHTSHPPVQPTYDVQQHPSKRQRVLAPHPNGGTHHGAPNGNSAALESLQPSQFATQDQTRHSQMSWRPSQQENRDSDTSYRASPDPGPNHSGKKRGRPRKYDSMDGNDALKSHYERPIWPAYAEGENGSNFYVHTMGSLEPSDRGRVIRRGTGGGIGDFGKRRRQKPVRNAEGILLRKDGKPDKRAVSSPMNLRKAIDKRKDDASSTNEISPTGGEFTAEDTPSREPEEVNATFESSSTPAASKAEVNSLPATDNTWPRGHKSVMKQMFPRGINDDAKRLNHAANIFTPNRSPEKERVQPRKDMQKEEMIRRSEEPHTISTPTSQPNGDSTSEPPQAVSVPKTNNDGGNSRAEDAQPIAAP